MTTAKDERLLTPRFLLVVGAGLSYFIALGMMLPVLPLYVRHELGAGDVAVGIAVGALFVGAVVLRPYAGRLGDRVGRRVLIIGGAVIMSAALAATGLVEALPYLVFVRVVAGIGEAAFFVGAATMVTDLSPETRRGEALSYWSVAIYGGLAVGPALGETVLGDDRFLVTWVVAAAFAGLAALLGVFTAEVARPEASSSGEPLWNRAALSPGFVLFLGLLTLAAFSTLVRLYAGDLGMGGAEPVFLLYGGLVLCVRIVGARLPDLLGARRAGTAALLGASGGMLVIAVWAQPAGLFVGTALFAAGMSLLYPALLLLALSRAPDTERGSVVGTFSSFFDLSQGVGALILGGVADLTGYRGAFATAGGLALIGIAVLRGGVSRRPGPPQPAQPGAEALPA
jgi:MFS family permease